MKPGITVGDHILQIILFLSTWVLCTCRDSFLSLSLQIGGFNFYFYLSQLTQNNWVCLPVSVLHGLSVLKCMLLKNPRNLLSYKISIKVKPNLLGWVSTYHAFICILSNLPMVVFTIPTGFGIGPLIAEIMPRSKGQGTKKHPVGHPVFW